MFSNDGYAIIVTNKTRIDRLTAQAGSYQMAVAKHKLLNKVNNLKFYEVENTAYRSSLETVQKKLSSILRYKLIDRSFLPSFIFKGEIPMVIVVGQDGLVANTAKYVRNIPIIAVNQDPEQYDGILLPFTKNDFLVGVEQVLSGHFSSRIVSLAEVKIINNNQRLLAFNDLFIGTSSHVSARYRIWYNGATEEQLSSGIIVSTKSGSTGWLSSIFNMLHGLPKFQDQKNSYGQKTPPTKITFGDNQLFFVVREPFASYQTGININGGVLRSEDQLVIESLMPDNGVIFSDGIESDFLQFVSGDTAVIKIAQETTTLVQKKYCNPKIKRSNETSPAFLQK
jgi:NAD kinase